MAGDFHSDALHVVERYRMTDPDTIQYEATIEDSKVFTKPWTISIPLHRRTDRDRLFEYVCQAEAEEANGAFTREERTWYPGNGTPPAGDDRRACALRPRLRRKPVANIRRTADGKPDLQGFYVPDAGGANYGLEKRAASGRDAGRTRRDRRSAGRECFRCSHGPCRKGPTGTGPNAVTTIRRRTVSLPAFRDRCMSRRRFTSFKHPITSCFCTSASSWRIVPLNGRAHLPDTIRLWQGDSVGRWEGDTLVVDTTNFNGKTWLNEGGEVVSYAEHVVERFTPAGPDTVNYEATVTDPVVYTRPWTIAFPFKRDKFELTEAACHEEDRDLPRLKALKDAAAAKK